MEQKPKPTDRIRGFFWSRFRQLRRGDGRIRTPYNGAMLRKLPLVSFPQPEGGFTVTSPALPALVTEVDTLDEAYANVLDSDSSARIIRRARPLIALRHGVAGIWSHYLGRIVGGGCLRYREIAVKLAIV